jgi:hypothetical protein
MSILRDEHADNSEHLFRNFLGEKLLLEWSDVSAYAPRYGATGDV